MERRKTKKILKRSVSDSAVLVPSLKLQYFSDRKLENLDSWEYELDHQPEDALVGEFHVDEELWKSAFLNWNVDSELESS